MKKSNGVLPVLFAVIGILLPFLCAFILTFFEPERAEAIASGLILGWALGAIMGVIALILNRRHKLKLVKILGVIDIVPICILGVLFAVYISYKPV